MIASSYPNAPALATVFAVPTSDQYSQNPNYWDAYKAEQAHVTNDCPSATNIPDWATYHAVILQSLPPVAPWNAAGVGTEACISDASNWEWIYNPNSGHNKVF